MTDTEQSDEGRRRAVIDRVEPQVDGGRFPVKRTVGDRVVVEMDAFCDGHDELGCALLYRYETEPDWREVPMVPLGNDRWSASFPVEELGCYFYRPLAWVDRFETWRHDFEKRVEAEQDVSVDLLIGAGLVREAAGRAIGRDRRRLASWAEALSAEREPPGGLDEAVLRPGKDEAVLRPGKDDAHAAASTVDGPPVGVPPERLALTPELADLVRRYPDRSLATRYERALAVEVDRKRARFSAWYELFPRSVAAKGGRHGTFHDVEQVLPYVRDMGFDVLYLPPIHPIGRTHRKGPDNVPEAARGDPGSPWAIGGVEGGHEAIHPELGTLEDFHRLVRRAREEGLEVALDIAFQCSPDHPWVREHPEWFRARPDGSIQYAENPPKKYEDIYPFDFESEEWRALWSALAGVFFHWIEQGVRIFRVDNPHTKPFAFWEWVIREVRARHPDVLFLSEAFTRPKVMYRLAKLGFTQSYTYFAWRNGSRELRAYVEELSKPPVRDFFRPNFWPNTPDILTEYLQTGGRGAFMARLVLAATLSSSYGIYGPAFELQWSTPRHEGSEEYLGSEKYQLRTWDLDRPDSLRAFIRRINQIRHRHPALQRSDNVRFHDTDNEALLAYSKATDDGSDVVLVVVNLDPHHAQSGRVRPDHEALGVTPHDEYRVHDVLGGERYLWRGASSYVALDPHVVPAHVFHVTPRVRTEADFEYYL